MYLRIVVLQRPVLSACKRSQYLRVYTQEVMFKTSLSYRPLCLLPERTGTASQRLVEYYTKLIGVTCYVNSTSYTCQFCLETCSVN